MSEKEISPKKYNTTVSSIRSSLAIIALAIKTINVQRIKRDMSKSKNEYLIFLEKAI